MQQETGNHVKEPRLQFERPQLEGVIPATSQILSDVFLCILLVCGLQFARAAADYPICSSNIS